MILWLVTRSHHYYPASGTYDWVLLTSDEAEARERFRSEAESPDWGADVFLLRLIGRSPGFPSEYDVLETAECPQPDTDPLTGLRS